MSSKCKFKGLRAGIIIGAVGVGLVLAVIIPFWGWILAAGCGLIYLGWYLIQHH